jgi:Helix-destabilising protein
MTIKVRIKSTAFDTKSGNSQKTGKSYSIREQSAFVLIGELILPLTLSLGRDQPVYAEGFYEVLDESFTTDAYGRLCVGKKGLILKSLVAAAAKVA